MTVTLFSFAFGVERAFPSDASREETSRGHVRRVGAVLKCRTSKWLGGGESETLPAPRGSVSGLITTHDEMNLETAFPTNSSRVFLNYVNRGRGGFPGGVDGRG